MKFPLAVLSGVGLAALTLAAPDGDKVTSLPGWDAPLPSNQWSGIVDTNSDKNSSFHYWLIESEGENPSDDPLVIWMNGGPGASSMFGILSELGPLTLNEDSLTTDPPSLFYNEFGWQTQANLLAIEQPPPTGFSYCNEDPAGDGASCGDWTDDTAAKENYMFLLKFMDEFPEFADRDLYITGESYAGIYVPLLADYIYDGKKSGENSIALKGLAVGDGVFRPSRPTGEWWNVQFMYGHGQVSTKMYDEIMEVCTEAALKNGTYGELPGCTELLARMQKSIGDYYSYNLYDTCNHNGAFLTEDLNPKLGGGLNDYSCGGEEAVAVWANRSDVREALNVDVNSAWNNVDGAWPSYKGGEQDLESIYRKWAEDSSSTTGNLRVLIYSGDTDPSVKAVSSEEWTSGMGYDEMEAWRPWVYFKSGEQHVGGYVTRYDIPASATGGSFDFLTIRGSGHMVPQMQPIAALEFFTRWLRNETYTPYGSTDSSNDATATRSSRKSKKSAALAAAQGELASRRRVWEAQIAGLEKNLEALRVE